MSASRTTLLLVEDDPQIQRFLLAALEAHAYELLIASTGAEGLKLAATRQPDSRAMMRAAHSRWEPKTRAVICRAEPVVVCVCEGLVAFAAAVVWTRT
jgi:ActR/RegA family two-component response regulator